MVNSVTGIFNTGCKNTYFFGPISVQTLSQSKPDFGHGRTCPRPESEPVHQS